MTNRRTYTKKNNVEFSDSEEQIYVPDVTSSRTPPSSKMRNIQIPGNEKRHSEGSKEYNENISNDEHGQKKSSRATNTDSEGDNKSYMIIGVIIIVVAVLVNVFMDFIRQPIVDQDAIIEKVVLRLGQKFQQEKTDMKELYNDMQKYLDSTKESVKLDYQSENDALKMELLKLQEEKEKCVFENITSMKYQVDDVKKELLENNQKQHESVLEKMETQRVELMESTNKLANEKQKEFERQMNGDMEEKVTNLQSVLTGQVNAVEAKFSADLDRVLENKKVIDETLKSQDNILSVIRENTFNKAAGITAIMLLYFLVIVLFILVCSKQGNRRPNATPLDLPNVYTKFNTGDANENLANAISVISFDDDSQKKHKQLMDAIKARLNTRLKKLPICYHVINRHDDIKSIPPSKLSFMFADFSERHVIIEQKGLGLGDLKRTTYEEILALQSDLVIIYVRDPGSRQVSGRYNTNIDCVTSQAELRVVNNRHRFFSVYDKLSEYQLQSLSDIIAETFVD